jgi:hypothetical protein
VAALKTSEQGESAAGEGEKDPAVDDRPVDDGAKIIIAPDAIAPSPSRPHRAVAPTAPRTTASPSQSMTTVVMPRRGGLGLVIVLYILSAAALAYAIYERFLAGN